MLLAKGMKTLRQDVVDAILKRAIRSSGHATLTGRGPNYVEVAIPRRITKSMGLERVAEMCRLSLVGLSESGRMSKRFVLVVDEANGVDLASSEPTARGPIACASRRDEDEILRLLDRDKGREEAGLRIVVTNPATTITVRTKWGATTTLDEPFFVGRGTDNDLVLDVFGLSGSHCELLPRPDGSWRMVDLSTTNGTEVNGVRVSDVTVRAGDKLSVASRLLLEVVDITPWLDRTASSKGRQRSARSKRVSTRSPQHLAPNKAPETVVTSAETVVLARRRHRTDTRVIPFTPSRKRKVLTRKEGDDAQH